MKIFGIVLIVAGILMCVFRTVSFTKKEKVLDLGPVEINKTEKQRLGWPVFAGVGIGLIGVAMVVMDKKNK
jgi:uncharacterized membrane protein YfcA